MNKLNTTKHSIFRQIKCLSSRAKILALLLIASAYAQPHTSFAASWEWLSVSPSKERLLINLDEPMPSFQSTRPKAKQVNIQTPIKTSSITLNGTQSAGNFIENVNVVDGNIEISFNKTDFGYIITQPSSSVIMVEVYHDPIMARFYSEDSETVPSVKQEAVTSPAPVQASQTQFIAPQNALPITPVQEQSTQAQEETPIQPTNIPQEITTNQSVIAQRQVTLPPVQTSQEQEESNSPLAIGSQTLALASKEEMAQKPKLVETPIVEENVNEVILAQNEVVAEPTQSIGNSSLQRPPLNAIPRPDITRNQFASPLPPPPVVEEVEEVIEEVAVPAKPIFYGNNFKADFNIDITSTDEAAIVQAPRDVMQSEQQTPYQFNATFAKAEELDESTPALTPVIPTVDSGQTSEVAVSEQTTESLNTLPNTEELTEEVASAEVESAEATTEEIDPNLLPTMPTTIEEAIAQNRPIVYQDIDGNPVPAPPDPKILLPQIQELMGKKSYAEVKPIIESLMTVRLSKDDNEHIKLKEQLLLDYARTLFALNEFDLSKQGQEILDASLEAMNYNPESPYVPELLMMIARTHLSMGNLKDAEGYVLMLTQLFPNERNNAPYLLYLVAQEQYKNGQYVDAVNTTQIISDNFPDLDIYKDASILQAYALYSQGHYDRALPLVQFINLRWPDAYIDNPEFLSVVADIQIAQKLFLDAADTLWVQYNLHPGHPDSPELLNRLILLYYTQNDKDGANKVQLELINTYPESEYTPAAMIRLAENMYLPPNPPLDTLLDMYQKPNPRLVSITYQQVIDEFPASDEAIESLVRLAAWEFFQQNYEGALEYAKNVMQKYPEKPQYNVANDILLRSFEARLRNALEEENFARALSLWEEYPEVHNYYQPFEDDLRVALARGYLNRGETQTGLDMLKIYLEPNQNEKYGIYAYNLFLTDYLSKGNWAEILTLDDNVKNWNMPLDVRNQHRYTVALASENLGLSDRALPLWEELVNEESIPLYQRAYANYFLARDAESKQDLRQSYQHNLDALAMFEELQEQGSEFSDVQRVRESVAALMDVTEVAGRFAESLDWLNRYASFVPQDSPDYAGLMLREARLYRKMGDMTRWQIILEDIVAREPDSVFGEMAASELNTQAMARDIDRLLEN